MAGEGTAGFLRGGGGVVPDADRRLQREARALGDPTRFAIFTHVAEAPAGVRVAALTDHLGLHPNAVRQHLAKLCEAGLLVEETAPRAGPGRPAFQYRVAPEAAGAWGTPGPYQQVAVLLARLVGSDRTPRELGAEAGREAVAAGPRGRDAVEGLHDEMARRGFAPRRVDTRAGPELVLERCPFEAAARANPDAVCDLHRGLAEGITAGLGGEVEVRGLIARHPGRAGCRLQLTRPPAPQEA